VVGLAWVILAGTVSSLPFHGYKARIASDAVLFPAPGASWALSRPLVLAPR
jgi:hypothetical protein